MERDRCEGRVCAILVLHNERSRRVNSFLVGPVFLLDHVDGAGLSTGGRQRASNAGGGRLWVTRVHGANVVLVGVPGLLLAARLRIDSPSRWILCALYRRRS